MLRDNAMKASIITVCYNSAATIEQTIQSVINQTYENIEYIIIDGGSTDGTVDIIKKYDSNIAYWVSEPDHGIYDAMNKGIAKAAGDIVGIINSDDWYAESAVEKAVKALENQKCQVAYGDLAFVSTDGKVKFASAQNIDPTDIFYRNIHWHPTVFVKRKIYQKYGDFDCRYKIYADYQFLLRLAYQQVHFCYIPYNMAYFRSNGYHSRVLWHCFKEGKKAAIEGLEKNNPPEKEVIRDKIEKHYDTCMCEIVKKFCKARMRKYNVAWRHLETVLTSFFPHRDSFKIFGAGVDGKDCCDYLLENNVEIKCFIDNDLLKRGGTYRQIPIFSPMEVGILLKVAPIIIATLKYRKEIRKQLEIDGLVYQKDFIYFSDLEEEVLRLYIKTITKINK